MAAIKKMTLKQKHIKLLLFVVIALAVALTAFRIYMITTEYEPETYFFKYSSILPDIFNYSIAALVVIILLFFIFTKKSTLPADYGKTTIPTIIMATATGFLALIGGLYAISRLLLSNDSAQIVQNVLIPPSESERRVELLAYIQCLLSLGVFAYFLLTAFSINRYSRMKSVFGMITILWHVIFILVIYFDMTRPINSPIRMMLQFAILSSMLFIIVEMRFLLGIAKPRLFMAVTFISVIVIMSAALPMTVCAIAGSFKMTLSNIIYSLHLVAMLGYILCRTITYIKQPFPTALENKTEEK